MNRLLLTGLAALSGFVAPIIPAIFTGHLGDPATWSVAVASALGAGKLYLTQPAGKPAALSTPQEAQKHMPTLIENLVITDGIPGLPSSVTIPLPAVPLDTWEADIATALAPNGISATGEALLTVVDGAIVLTATENLDAGSAVSKKFGQGVTVKTNLASVLAFVVPASGISVTLAYQATVGA